MLFKIISLFLVGMAVLAMFGKLRMPRIGGGAKRQLDALKCPKCGTFRIGKGPCNCGHKE